MVDTFVPILTSADLDAVRNMNLGKDPREPWNEQDLAAVLLFLAYAAEWKSIQANSQAVSRVYETMLYEYATIAADIECVAGII